MSTCLPSVAFSLGMHALLLCGFLFLSQAAPPVTETVYRVSLAELAQPASPPAPEPQAPEPAAPEPQAAEPVTPEPPEPQAPEPKPVPEPRETAPEPPEPEPEPAVKQSSPRKTDSPPTPRPKPRPSPRAAPDGPARQAPAAPAGPVPRSVGGFSVYESDALDQRPSVTRRVTPEYPIRARRMNVQGVVTVQMVVDTSGRPQHCTVVRAQPDGYCEEAALGAARRMRFMPGRLRGQPVNTLVMLPFSFRLR